MNMPYKEWKYYLVAVYFVAAPYWLPIMVHSAIAIICVFFLLASSHFVVSKKIFFVITPFVFLLPIGLINAWHWRVDDALRDGWYVINPMVILLAGWIFSERVKGDPAIILKAIIVAGVASSIYHFYMVYKILPELDGGFFAMRNQNILFKKGSVLSVMALSVLLLSEFKRFVNWKIRTKILIFLICATSFGLSLSRSWLMAMIILILFLLLIKIKNRKSVFIFSVFVSIVIVSLILITAPADVADCTDVVCKISESILEMIPKDYVFIQDINLYWRGYETYMGMRQYQTGNLFELIFGQGFGALIDLKFTIKLGEGEFDMVPILHNGYVYALVKFGFIGLILYIAQCYRFVVFGLRCFGDRFYAQRLMGAYIVALTTIMIVLTFANSGFFNIYSLNPVLFFLAAFIRSRWYEVDRLIKS